MADGLKRAAEAPLRSLDELGDQGWLYIRALGWLPRTLSRYKKEVLRILTEVTFGAGGLALVGGTVIIVALLTSFTGSVVGLQTFAGLNQIGAAALTAFIAAYFNTREISPLVAAIGLTATVGAGFTAQLGAMRVSEEIDALGVMAVPSLPFLVTTRVIAAFVAIIPLYAGGLLASYWASRFTVTVFYGQSLGTYDHYFNLFLPPIDILYSFLKVLVIAVLIILIHCYYGYRATGGPAGVGVAVGRSVRASLVLIFLFDIFVSLALWGSTTTVKIA
ncbi:MAG: phospholipid/cholesterol/gamma-HCH transport system permease protein [Pseudonocardiales bacterium]|nr:phospholipid/cholesterol/gamma-HCH transport system permease protein [Pseudonocardiales bacterium]